MMIPSLSRMQRLRTRRAGFTLIEAVMSVLIVGVMYAAVLNTVGQSGKAQLTITLQRKGEELAQHLMSEIVQQYYDDPASTGTIGPESLETLGTRANFDDVDDYHNWKESPPTLKDGTLMTDFNGWTREVEVKWVRTNDPSSSDSSDTGLKRITVTTSFNGKTIATLTALRANLD